MSIYLRWVVYQYVLWLYNVFPTVQSPWYSYSLMLSILQKKFSFQKNIGLPCYNSAQLNFGNFHWLIWFSCPKNFNLCSCHFYSFSILVLKKQLLQNLRKDFWTAFFQCVVCKIWQPIEHFQWLFKLRPNLSFFFFFR